MEHVPSDSRLTRIIQDANENGQPTNKENWVFNQHISGIYSYDHSNTEKLGFDKKQNRANKKTKSKQEQNKEQTQHRQEKLGKCSFFGVFWLFFPVELFFDACVDGVLFSFIRLFVC